MKKEIVKINDKYAARFKRWYHIGWRYIGVNQTWGKRYLKNSFILEDTYEAAKYKLDLWFPVIKINW